MRLAMMATAMLAMVAMGFAKSKAAATAALIRVKLVMTAMATRVTVAMRNAGLNPVATTASILARLVMMATTTSATPAPMVAERRFAVTEPSVWTCRLAKRVMRVAMTAIGSIPMLA